MQSTYVDPQENVMMCDHDTKVHELTPSISNW
jgi:hypothetical protein